MKLIKESPEHHFLTFIERIKGDASGWIGFHFALSKKLKHDDVVAEPKHIKGKLRKLREQGEEIVKTLVEKTENNGAAMLYWFSDSDIILLLRPEGEADREEANTLYKIVEEKIGKSVCMQINLSKDIYSLQKLADERFLAESKIKAYQDMADSNRITSISVRRARHDDAVVMIVEDDRFTASYAANILNKEYEVVVSKTGEEAISDYIENAPDIVFLDIHLPGLDGLQTLRAIRNIDPESFIIMLSVDTVKQNIVGSNEGGASGFLKKPFSKERLLTAVEKSPFVKEIKQKSGS